MTSPLSKRANRYSYIGAIVALLGIGATIRAWGVLIEPLDLWADEAWWATLLESRGLGEFGFRPIGYMWVCRQLFDLGDPEVMLRLPSYLASVGALVFIYKSAALLYRSRTAVVFVLVLAVFHPFLIVFAKEFKPYSVEVFVFSALTYWALRGLRRECAGAGLWTAAAISLPFCYPAVFMYPALALAFAGEQLTVLGRFARRHAVIVLLIVIPALFVVNLLLFDLLDAGTSRFFWGNKYGVFPIDVGFLGGLGWYVRKTWALMAFPGAIDAIPAYVLFSFGVAYIGGVAALLNDRRFRELALLATPFFVAAMANLLGYWPYGSFRTNLFLLPGGLLLIGVAVDWLAAQRLWRFVGYAMLIGVLVAISSIDPATYRTKSMAHWAPAPQLTEVLDDIDRRLGETAVAREDIIVADWHSWRPISFYLRYYPDLRRHVRLVQGPVNDLSRLEAQIAIEVERGRREKQSARLWIVVTRLIPHGAIDSSTVVSELAVYRREFATHDPDYHPILIELRY